VTDDLNHRTGLFLISGATIATAGPVGALLAFIVAGIFVYLVVATVSSFVSSPVQGINLTVTRLVRLPRYFQFLVHLQHSAIVFSIRHWDLRKVGLM
jgi:L-asparagine transporter-like permease